MDFGSQQSIQILNAIGKSVAMLHSHGYNLYLKTRAKSWTNRRNISVGAEPFFFVFGNAILPSPASSLDFGITLSWGQNEWEILAEIECETYGEKDTSEILWEKKYRSPDFNEFLDFLSTATEDLVRETSSDWFISRAEFLK